MIVHFGLLAHFCSVHCVLTPKTTIQSTKTLALPHWKSVCFIEDGCGY